MNSPPIILSRPHRPQHSPTRHPIRKLSRMRHNPRTHSQSRIRRQPIKTNPNINNLLPPHPLQRKRHSRPPHPVNIRIPHLHTIIRIPLTIRFKPPRRDLSQINLRINPHRKHPTPIIQPPPPPPGSPRPGSFSPPRSPPTPNNPPSPSGTTDPTASACTSGRARSRPAESNTTGLGTTNAATPKAPSKRTPPPPQPRGTNPGDTPRHDHSTRPDAPGAFATSKNSSTPTSVTSNTRSVSGNTPGYSTLLPRPPGATTPSTRAAPGTLNPTPNPPTDTPKSRTSSARSANTGDNG